VDRRRAHAEFFRGENLIAHQREQRADEDRRPRAGVAEDFRRQEIDDALAPAGALHDEEALLLVRDGVNRLPLAVAELRRWPQHLPQQ
jgi:hypothetical protein